MINPEIEDIASDKHERQNPIAQFGLDILVACARRDSISSNENGRRQRGQQVQV